MGPPCLICLPVTTLFWLFHLGQCKWPQAQAWLCQLLVVHGGSGSELALILVWNLIPTLLTCVSDLGQVTCVWPAYVRKACCCTVTKWCLTLLQPHGLWSTRLLCPWDSQTRILERVALLFSRGSSWPREANLGLLTLQTDSLPSESPGKPKFFSR